MDSSSSLLSYVGTEATQKGRFDSGWAYFSSNFLYWRAVGTPTFNGWGLINELTNSQYAPFSHKIALFFSFFGGPTPKKREHYRERTWTAEAPSTNFANFGVHERAKIRL